MNSAVYNTHSSQENNAVKPLFMKTKMLFPIISNYHDLSMGKNTKPIQNKAINLNLRSLSKSLRNKINKIDVCSSSDDSQLSCIKKSRIPFSNYEDEMLIKLVKQFGTKSWRMISLLMTGRSPKQCRDRYCNYLTPGFFNGEWTKEEDDLLIELYKKNGSRWSIIKKAFPSRSQNSLKNRWMYFLCRQNKSNIIKDKIMEEEKNEYNYFDVNEYELNILDLNKYQNDDPYIFDENGNFNFINNVNTDDQPLILGINLASYDSGCQTFF